MQKKYVLYRSSGHHYVSGSSFCETVSGATQFALVSDVVRFVLEPGNEWLRSEAGLEVHAVQISAEDLGRV